MARPGKQHVELVDTGMDLAVPDQRPERRRPRFVVVVVVAAGGGLGAAGRYGAELMWPAPKGMFPATTLLINIVGCALIGALMVAVTEAHVHWLVRPFLGTGTLGGFTTFSTWALDVQELVGAGRVTAAMAYLIATVAAALVAVWAASWVTRRLMMWMRR